MIKNPAYPNDPDKYLMQQLISANERIGILESQIVLLLEELKPHRERENQSRIAKAAREWERSFCDRCGWYGVMNDHRGNICDIDLERCALARARKELELELDKAT